MPRLGLVIAGIVFIGILIGSVVFVLFALPQQNAGTVAGTDGGTQAPSQETRSPEVHLYKKSPRLLLLTWGALPAGTRMIDIYRSPKGKNQWTKWKTVPIIPGREGGGSIDIVVSANENLNLYTFYTQAVAPAGAGPSTGSGQAGGTGTTVLWTSSSTVIEAYVPPPTPAATSTPGSGTPPAGATSTPPASPPSTSTPPATPPAAPPATSTPTNPNQVIYYAPDGSISGSSTIETAEAFWVRHTDRRIEVGWQNIAVGLDAAVVYRATNSSGPWTELLRQENPPSSYVIRLIDDTVDQAHYYRMITYAGGATIKTYGPEYLPALN